LGNLEFGHGRRDVGLDFMRKMVVLLSSCLLAFLGVVAAPSASAAVVNGGTLNSGVSVTRSVLVAGQDVKYTFAATSGQHVTFDVTAANWANGSGAGNAYLFFANPSGTRISTYCAMSTAPTSCDFTPTVTGTWTVLLDPSGGATGKVTFKYV
jgi:hypothetical protein